MHKKYLLVSISIIILIFVISCNTHTKNNETYLVNYLSINSFKLTDNVLLQDPDNSPVVSICYKNDKTIYIASSKKGKLIHYDVQSNSILGDYILGFAQTKTLAFSTDCSKLIGSKHREISEGNTEYVNDIRVWDTQEGKQIKCFGYCGDKDNIPMHKGASINLDGDNIIIYLLWHYMIIGNQNSNGDVRPNQSIKPTIEKIIFSPLSNNYAISYLEGGIEYESNSLFQSRWISKNNNSEAYKVDALSISPDEHYLARIRNNKLSVWDIRFLNHKIVIDENIDGENILAFDQSGEILFVAGNNHIIIWDIKNNTKIKDLEANAVTCMTVSDDNSLIWGDSDGTIHLLGVQQ